jgi:hypothetical protein
MQKFNVTNVKSKRNLLVCEKCSSHFTDYIGRDVHLFEIQIRCCWATRNQNSRHDTIWRQFHCTLLEKNVLSASYKLEYLSGIALGYGLNDRGFESRQEMGIFLLTTAFRPALGPTEPLSNGYQGLFPWGVEHPGRETDHPPPSGAEIKNAWSYTSTPPVCLYDVVLN